jgi:BirA family biotin operon repressor/biotin-[acetyl-CoA-carboxylase] ligase
MLGTQVQAMLPDGQVFITGTFAGIDVWGKATVVTPDGAEMEISSEQASLRPLA